MKNLTMIALIATLGFTNIQAKDTNVEACKTYINEAKNFQATMDTSKTSQATLAFYKEQVTASCNGIASRNTFKKELFSIFLMKKDNTTIGGCKLAIDMAKTYASGKDTSVFIANAHKVNVTDNCGTLVAKKVPAFCLFETVDNSLSNLKEKCIVAIEKAHASKDTEAFGTLKNEVVANCGRVQASI
jgi:hypothetical protein